jgi:hypothetical protein
MTLIGQTLERRRKVEDKARNRVTVTGWNGRAYVCQSAAEFGEAFLLTEAEIAADYGTRVDPVEDDLARMQRVDTAATRAARAQFRKFAKNTQATPAETSPEGIFAALAAEAAADDATD